MEIRETLFTKSFSVESESPYALALDFMKKLSGSYMLYERENTVGTDGPTTRSSLVFDLVEPFDTFSRVVIKFSMTGENNVLYVDVAAEFVMKIKDTGYFTEIFTEFYLGNIFPSMKKLSEKHVRDFSVKLEKI